MTQTWHLEGEVVIACNCDWGSSPGPGQRFMDPTRSATTSTGMESTHAFDAVITCTSALDLSPEDLCELLEVDIPA